MLRATIIARVFLACIVVLLSPLCTSCSREAEQASAAAAAVPSAHSQATRPSTRHSKTTPPLKSIVPTPRTWSGPGMIEAFKTARDTVSMICLPDPVDWFDARGKPAEQSKPHQDAQWQQVLIQQHHLQVFIQLDPYKNRRGQIPDLPKTVQKASFADPALRKAFLADALQRVKLYDPTYVCLAMEINAYHEQNPQDFDNFVSLFREARGAIKKLKPDAIVFVSFQYEQLLGLFGGQADLPKHPPQWDLFDKFADADAIGISSYPMETLAPPRFGNPADLPADYYSRIAAHTSKPIIFAELGWPSSASFGGSSESQAAFVQRVPRLLEGMDVRLVNWFLLYDAKGFGEVFESMGLLDDKGNPKPALEAWRGLWR